MPIQQIIIRSLSGYLFVIPMLIFYWIALFRSGNKQSLLRIVAILAFGYYLIGVLTVTGIHELKAFSPRLVLVPFLDMIRGPMDTVLNIILFLPFGFFLPLLYRKYNRAIQVVFAGFLLSLSIEVLQMFGMGTTDINDLITNTIGLSISFRQEEIHIMRLIGATKFFIRQPFIVEGILIGLIGAGIPLIAIYYIYERLVRFAAERLQLLSGLFVFLPVRQIMIVLIPVALGLGVGIGFFGSIFSVRKHLKA